MIDTRFDLDYCEHCDVRKGYVYISHHKGGSVWLCDECEKTYHESLIDEAEYTMDDR